MCFKPLQKHICMYVCMYVCVYVCIYIYIYIYCACACTILQVHLLSLAHVDVLSARANMYSGECALNQCACVCECVCTCLHKCMLFCTNLTAILIITEGQFQASQRFSSSKLVLKAVESYFTALNYYENGSSWFVEPSETAHFSWK